MNDSASILAIDTATGPCSVAVWYEGRVAAYLEDTQMPVRQSACLLPMIEKALAKSGLGYGDLTAVACTIGPGSFTGIRIGLAAARGIAFSSRLTQLGFTTLEVMAFAAESQRVLAMLNAGKSEYYYQYSGSEVRLGSLDEAIASVGKKPVTVAGNVAVPTEGFTPCPITFPRADALAALAAAKTASAVALKPFYIRAPDAKLPAKIV